MLVRTDGRLLKENTCKIVPASMLLHELQKADGSWVIRANLDAKTVCGKKSNLEKKFSVVAKNGGQHKCRFRRC
jgi:hypothetical protein